MLHHDHLPYASPWRRLAALLLDLLIVLVATLILFVPLFMIVSPRTAASPEFESRTNALGYLISWMYFALMESSAKQATIGKSLLGLVVTDLNGDRISFWRATGRHFGKWISALILLIGYFMAFFTEKRQALHDMMAGCLVLHAPPDGNPSMVRENSPLHEARSPISNTSPPASPPYYSESHASQSTAVHARHQSVAIDEDAIYEIVANEMESGKTDKGLWTRLFAQCDGDENKTKAAYIKHRATLLIAEKRAELDAATPAPAPMSPAAEPRPWVAVKVVQNPGTSSRHQSWAHELAAIEIENLKVDRRLWDEVLTLSDGDKNAAKFEYIQRRAKVIATDEKLGGSSKNPHSRSRPISQLLQDSIKAIRELDIKAVRAYVAEAPSICIETDGEGNTLLLIAASIGALSILQFLLANGSDPLHRNNNGRTATDLVRGNLNLVDFNRDRLVAAIEAKISEIPAGRSAN